jgi:DNA gyrase subunit A
VVSVERISEPQADEDVEESVIEAVAGDAVPDSAE